MDALLADDSSNPVPESCFKPLTQTLTPLPPLACQDLLGLSDKYCKRPALEEVINDPTVAKHYWRYRMHITLDDLMQDRTWVQQIRTMVLDSGRA